MPTKKKTFWQTIRNRIVAGLFVALPVFITFLVLDWIYRVLIKNIIGPLASSLLDLWLDNGAVAGPAWLTTLAEYVLAPLAAIFVVLAFLFMAGMFFRSRIHRLMDWLFLNVPGVNMIYSSVKNVFDAMQRSHSVSEGFQRVVLIEFPHPGSKVPAFVTSETKDDVTGQKILSVYVPTTPLPTSGYMLLIPEADVVELDWELQETVQAIVSGGITLPQGLNYQRPHLET